MIYSPDIFDGVMYLGGWLTQNDIGPDQLYRSTAGEDAPAPLVWDDGDPNALYHLNDPYVVASDGKLLMFCTASPNSATSAAGENRVGLAVSSDDGASWTWKGVVVGQNNGLDGNGAWSPTALATGGGIDVWYNTNTATPAVYMSRMSTDGTTVQSTTACIDTATGQDLSMGNVDITQLPNGTYWMVGNGTGYLAFTGFTSADGINWTPWNGPNGDGVLIPPNGATQFAPTIESVTDSSITLLYSDLLNGLSGSGTEERQATIDLTGTQQADFLEYETNWTAVEGIPLAGDNAFTGGASYLDRDLVDLSPTNLSIFATAPNVFIATGGGNDALVALSGHNILSGGGGSNVLEGGNGVDTFFVTADGTPTWDEIINFHPGDDITFWGIVPDAGNATLQWQANEGLPNYPGATLVLTNASGNSAALTIAGYSVGQAEALGVQFGTAGAGPYMHLS